MVFLCKKCKKAFRKDMASYEDSDEYCPHCDNHYVSPSRGCVLCSAKRMVQVIDAKTPEAVIGVEGEDPRVDARYDCHL